MKLSDYVIKFIEQKGIDTIFGYVGGSIIHLVDSAYKNQRLKFIQVYHEQTASIAAEGYARYSNNVGVAMATSGPGATNMITGIADAYFDSIPVVYITGQVNTYEYKYNKTVRQQGFQETDIVSIVKPITKYCKLIDNAEDIKFELEKAFFIAKEGRPGPVLLDIPMDIQRAKIDLKTLKSFSPAVEKKELPILKKVLDSIARAKRPIILAGGGANNEQSKKLLLEYAEANKIPVAVSLMGKGVFPEDNPMFVGMIGSYGNRCANMSLANADLVIALGTRLDTRQAGTNLKSFVRKGKIIHVDIDLSELKCNRIQNRIKVNCRAQLFLKKLIDSKIRPVYNEEWGNYIASTKKKYSQASEVKRFCANKAPYEVMKILSDCSSLNQVFTADIGQNQMFAAQSLVIKQNQNFYTSGGMAPMGYSVPAAIGVAFCGNKKHSVIAIVGDGGLHISVQSLMLLSQYNLPIKVVVLNNRSLGMIVQFQNLYFDGNKVATTKENGYLVPDFKLISGAYNLKYGKISNIILQKGLLKKYLKQNGPMLIEINTGEETTVSPKLEVSQPIENMNPRLPENELKENMMIDSFKE